MFLKGNDLAERFPEIQKMVEQLKASSAHDVIGLLFCKKERTSAGNFFRVKGELSQKQISALMQAHNMPKVGTKGVKMAKKDGWTEYSSPLTFEHLKLEDLQFFDEDLTLQGVYDDLGNDETESVVFVNGRVTGSDRDWEYLNPGDVVVIISDNNGEEWGSSRKFTDMPTLKVYQETLSGPFAHPDLAGNQPSDVSDDDDLVRALRLKRNDEVICPSCGEGDCDDHYIQDEEMVLVRRAAAQPKLLYTIQSPILITEDATEALRFFAQAVIGRGVPDNDWPDEVTKLTIDGSDETGSTCGEDVDSDSEICAILADPRALK